MTFQNTPQLSLGTRLKCHIAAIGEKKVAKCVRINRLRFLLAIKFAVIGEQNRLVCRRLYGRQMYQNL